MDIEFDDMYVIVRESEYHISRLILDLSMICDNLQAIGLKYILEYPMNISFSDKILIFIEDSLNENGKKIEIKDYSVANASLLKNKMEMHLEDFLSDIEEVIKSIQ